MIKAEVKKMGTEIAIKGPEPVILAEATLLMQQIYESLKENNGEKMAKSIITNLCEATIRDPEESCRIWEERKKEDPFYAWMAEEMARRVFGGKSDGK